MSFFTMSQLSGDDPEDEGARLARSSIAAYVSCMKRQGLQRAFYLQDPRQEVVTAAHRRGDPCYQYVSDAILAYAAPLASELARQKGASATFTVDQALLMQRRYSARASFSANGVTFAPDELGMIFESATESAEHDASVAASKQVGEVRAQDVARTAEEMEAHQEAVRSGEVVREPLNFYEDVISPREQRRLEEEAAQRAAARPKLGPTRTRWTVPEPPPSSPPWGLIAAGAVIGVFFVGVLVKGRS